MVLMVNLGLNRCLIRLKLHSNLKGVGAEKKSLTCGETGILLKLDIMEGKEANQ